MHRGQASQGLSRIRLRAGLDGECERRVQVLDRLLGLAEQELQTAEVEHQAADRAFVIELLIERPSLLRVLARQDEVPHLLCDE